MSTPNGEGDGSLDFQYTGLVPSWLRWALLLVALYFGVTEAWPWLQRQLASDDGAPIAEGSSEGADCVDRARRASDAFAAEARSYSSPPIDASAWSQAAYGLRSAVGEARTACTCPLESCRTASSALSQIEGLISSLDTAARGGSAPLGLAAHMNDTDDLLNRAQQLARRGQ